MCRKNKLINLYLIISFIGIITFFIVLLFNKNILTWLVMEHNFDYTFSDFFRQIVYASDLQNIYSNIIDTPFPPFIYLLFYLLWKINPINYAMKFESWKICANNKLNLFIFLVIIIVSIVLLFNIINKILKRNKKYKNVLFIISLLLSAPFLAGVLERGNPALLVLILLLYAIYLKNSDNLIFKELALIFIAIATAFKIYPAIMIFLYLKEKRYKEFLRLLIYMIIIFFVPYIFTGGISSIINHFMILSGFEKAIYGPSIRFTSIRCFFYSILQLMGIKYKSQFVIVGFALENLFLFFSIIIFYQSHKEWKKLLYLCGIMSVYLPNSFRYTSIYMVIPLCFFLKSILDNKENINKVTYCYIVLFALIFTIPIYGFMLEVDFLIYIPIYLLLLISSIDDLAKLSEK